MASEVNFGLPACFCPTPVSGYQPYGQANIGLPTQVWQKPTGKVKAHVPRKREPVVLELSSRAVGVEACEASEKCLS